MEMEIVHVHIHGKYIRFCSSAPPAERGLVSALAAVLVSLLPRFISPSIRAVGVSGRFERRSSDLALVDARCAPMFGTLTNPPAANSVPTLALAATTSVFP